jgi:hypothetical protein
MRRAHQLFDNEVVGTLPLSPVERLRADRFAHPTRIRPVIPGPAIYFFFLEADADFSAACLISSIAFFMDRA